MSCESWIDESGARGGLSATAAARAGKLLRAPIDPQLPETVGQGGCRKIASPYSRTDDMQLQLTCNSDAHYPVFPRIPSQKHHQHSSGHFDGAHCATIGKDR